MKKQEIFDKMFENTAPYDGVIYLSCCIGVEYDYDIVSHFIEYYKNIGVDEFLIVLNTNVSNSERLEEVQNILKEYDIKEKRVWHGPYDNILHTLILMDMIEENTNREEWILTADVDEFHEYPYDLRKFISYLDKNKYEAAYGVLVDRLTCDHKIIGIDQDTNLFEAFPLKTNLSSKLFNNPFDFKKVMIHKSYIKLITGQHDCLSSEGRKFFPSMLNVHHFKWRGNILRNQKDRAENFKNKGYACSVFSEIAIRYCEEMNG